MVYKIGIDFHGVITSNPEAFKIFCKELRAKGVMVYVISGGPKKDVEKYLDEYGIEYDVVWAIFDHYDYEGIVTRFDDGSFQVPTDLWNKAKARYCAKEGILFHIDDSAIYGEYFITPYCLYDTTQSVCTVDKSQAVDFNNPEVAVDEVYSFLTRA